MIRAALARHPSGFRMGMSVLRSGMPRPRIATAGTAPPVTEDAGRITVGVGLYLRLDVDAVPLHDHVNLGLASSYM